MAITVTKYDNFLYGQMNGTTNGVIDFDTDTIKMALATNTYTPNAATHDFFDDVTNEVTGTNYTAGGATLANKTLTLTAGTVKFTADPVTWTASGSGFSNARYAIVYKSTGTASTSRLLFYVDFGGDVGNTVADLVVTPNAAGLATWA